MEKEFNLSYIQKQKLDPNRFAEIVEEIVTYCPDDKLSEEILDLMTQTL